MAGRARLKAKLCPVKFSDKYADFKENCTFTTEEMLAEDPNERVEAHVGSETEKTNTEVCKLSASSGSREN